jgi:hypothetical protein
MNSTSIATSTLDLSAGEWVEVRSADEILATLDDNQALDGLPFMPEMLQYCGKKFRVYKSAHKTCDTIQLYIIRRMADAVHLEHRCDGSAHDGCQASCLIFWKTAWLKRVSNDASANVVATVGSERVATMPAPALEKLHRATRDNDDPETGMPRYRCQATDLLKATTTVRRRERWNPLFYVRDLTSRNVGVGEFVWYGVGATINAFCRRWLGWRFPRLRGLAKGQTPTATLNLRAGELVQIRTKDEIMQTLTPQLRNRGLWFDVEAVPYCGSTFRVLRRVDKIIDEKTGRMITMPNPGVILDGVVCAGHNAVDRMFCPREIYMYWREIWLKRVGPEDVA